MTWTARFIAPVTEQDSAPALRREFDLWSDHGPVRSAELAVTALGVVDAFLNGVPVSDALLTPGWTSYEWRLRVARHDVTALVSPGPAVLGLVVGDGWFRGHLGWTGAKALYGDTVAGFAELTVRFEDGAVQVVATDDSWSAGPSAVLANDLYDGETIDARRRDDGWLRPGSYESAAAWGAVRVVEHDLDTLTEYVGPLVSPREELAVQRIWTSPSGKTLVDFGQNLVGWIRATVRGPAGAEVVVRHAEVLEHEELGVRPLRSAKATDRYVLSGGEDVFEPTFTFHGFRYAQIDGWPGELRAEDLTAVVIGSELQRIGTFASSDPLLNRFHENVVWGMRGNFVDVPTDCPQRDERLGWTGDIAAFVPTAAYLYNVETFLSDWLIDLDLEQRHQDGIVPFVIPDAIKYFATDVGNGDRAETTALWSDAAVWVPWSLWWAYGHRGVLEQQFGSMLAHLWRIKGLLSPDGLWDSGFQYGDWLDPDAPPEAPDKAKADKGVVATAVAARSARIVAEAAAILGAPEQHEVEALADRLRHAFRAHYVHGGRITSDATTVYSLAIAFDLLEGAEIQVAGDRLAELVEAAGFRISTGFAGTPFIAEALTRTGHLEVAYRLLLQRENPSWLYPVTMGATTVWERYDSMLPDGTINPGEMTSFNHYALGAVADWMHRTVAGIAPLQPGYRRIQFAPQPGGGITSAAASVITPHGKASISWRSDEGLLTVDVEVPPAADAVLTLPGGVAIDLGPGAHAVSVRV